VLDGLPLFADLVDRHLGGVALHPRVEEPCGTRDERDADDDGQRFDRPTLEVSIRSVIIHLGHDSSRLAAADHSSNRAREAAVGQGRGRAKVDASGRTE